jgi:hypothetical protein
MKDIQTHLDKIRSDAAECHLLSNLVTDGKRAVFAKTAEHLNALALEVEKTIAPRGADVARTAICEEAGASPPDGAAAPNASMVVDYWFGSHCRGILLDQ